MRELFEFICIVILFLLIIIPMWKICGKTGMRSALSLLILIPFVGWPVLFIVLAFSDWPVLSKPQ